MRLKLELVQPKAGDRSMMLRLQVVFIGLVAGIGLLSILLGSERRNDTRFESGPGKGSSQFHLDKWISINALVTARLGKINLLSQQKELPIGIPEHLMSMAYSKAGVHRQINSPAPARWSER